MQRNIVIALLFTLLSTPGLALEAGEEAAAPPPAVGTAEPATAAPEKRGTLNANFKRVALEFSSVSVQHAEQYQDSPVAALKADDQTMIKGVFDFTLEYEIDKLRWDNSLYLGYGKTEVKPSDGGPKTSTENEDMILLSSDLAYKLWIVRGADVGPFGQLGYQTEFTSNGDAPLNKVFRSKGGLKAFNGKYFSNLYVAAVGEYDITYSEHKTTKLAGEAGFNVKYPLREGVEFQAEGYYRDYWAFSEYVGTDLKYDLNLVGRMNVRLWKKFSLSPFVAYRMAKSRAAEDYAGNLQIGLSLAFTDLWNIW